MRAAVSAPAGDHLAAAFPYLKRSNQFPVLLLELGNCNFKTHGDQNIQETGPGGVHEERIHDEIGTGE